MIRLNNDTWIKAEEIQWMSVDMETIWPEEQEIRIKRGVTSPPDHFLRVKTALDSFQTCIFMGTEEECRNEALRLQTEINQELRP